MEVSPQVLSVPDIYSYNCKICVLIVLTGKYAYVLIRAEVQITLLFSICFLLGRMMIEELKNGEISKEVYDQLRYNYPNI